MHRIDPRIVIIQIALSGICAFWIFKPLAMLCEVIFLMSFLLYLQHPKEALRLGVWFAFLVGLYALLNERNAPQIIVQPVFLLRKHRLTRAHREKQLKMSCQALHNAPPNRT